MQSDNNCSRGSGGAHHLYERLAAQCWITAAAAPQSPPCNHVRELKRFNSAHKRVLGRSAAGKVLGSCSGVTGVTQPPPSDWV